MNYKDLLCKVYWIAYYLLSTNKMFALLYLLATHSSALVLPLKATRIQPSPKPYMPNEKISLASTLVQNSYNLQYSTIIGFGTPVQQLSLTLDTGSSYTWVPSTNCYCHESLNSFDDKASSTYRNLSQEVTLRYGIGAVKGYFSKDTLTLGDLKAQNQTFVLTTFDTDLDSLASDGLLGLGFKELSDNTPTFIDTLKSQNQISSSIFSFYINNKDNSYTDSVFTIGEYGLQKYGTGVSMKIDVIEGYGFWLSYLDSFYVGGKKLNRKMSIAIIDLGSSLISAPQTMYKKYSREIMANNKKCMDIGFIVCDCSFGDYRNFPDLVYTMNGVDFVIHAENYIYYENGYCYLLLEGNGLDEYWILGQPFFREYYTVFDMENKQITASPANRGGKPYNYFVMKAAFGTFALVATACLARWAYKKDKSEEYTRLV